MILLPGCGCCGCPCGDETMEFPADKSILITVTFSNSQNVDLCMSDAGTLTLNNAEYCEYYADYEVTGIDGVDPCVVRIFYIVNGPGCSYIVNGWSTSCSFGVASVMVSDTPCT